MFAFQAQGIEQYPEGAVSEEQQWCKVVGGGLRTDQDDQVVCWTLKFVVLLLMLRHTSQARDGMAC